jgi:NitT/TauT family transport system substrate-binding protein
MYFFRKKRSSAIDHSPPAGQRLLIPHAIRSSRLRYIGFSGAMLTVSMPLVIGCSSGPATSGSGNNSAPATAQQLETVKVGIATSAISAPLYVGIAEGIFKKYGLDITISSLTPTASAAALASGSVDIGSDGPNVVAGILKEKSGKVIFTNGVTAFQIAVKPNITSIQQLRGATVATTTPGGSADTALRRALQASGLVPDKDVKITYVSQNSAALASVNAGRVQGAVVSPPTSIQAEASMGLKVLDISKYATPSITAVNGNFAESHKAEVIKFLQAYGEATRLTISNQAVAVSAFEKSLGIADKGQAVGTWQIYRSIFAMDPFSVDNMKLILANLNPPSTAAPASVIDNQYLDAIGQSSWVIPPASGS